MILSGAGVVHRRAAPPGAEHGGAGRAVAWGVARRRRGLNPPSSGRGHPGRQTVAAAHGGRLAGVRGKHRPLRADGPRGMVKSRLGAPPEP